MNQVKRCRYGDMVYLTNDLYVGRSFDLYGEFSEGEVALFRELVKAGQTVLDVGAKWGGLGECARRLGMDIIYTGLELSEANVQKAAALGLDVRLSDASRPLPIDDQQYDAVICSHRP